MMELVQANWLLLVIALVIGIVVAWWVFVAGRKTRVISTRPDVLDEGAAPAQRNQALIDSPPAAVKAEPAPEPTPAPETRPEPVVIVEPAPEPIPAPPPPAPPPPAPTAADDLKRIKGLGPKLERLVNELGVTSFAQIAAWNEADVDRIDAQLGTFAGRIRRDNWIEQARLLSAGDTAGFEGKFGSL